MAKKKDVWGWVKKAVKRGGKQVVKGYGDIYSGVGDVFSGDSEGGLSKIGVSALDPSGVFRSVAAGVSPDAAKWINKATESSGERTARLDKADTARDKYLKKKTEDALEASEAELSDFVTNYEDFQYDPTKSDTLSIYQRQAAQMADEERRNLARLLARSGGASSGAAIRGGMRIGQAQKAQMDQNVLGDISQSYGRYQDKYSRDFQGQLLKNKLVGDAYNRALETYNQNQAVRQQNAIQRMQQNQNLLNMGLGAAKIGAAFTIPGAQGLAPSGATDLLGSFSNQYSA